LESIRDGRTLYVGRERITDQTRHPAFAGGARTYAALYDMKCDPALRDIMTFEDADGRYNAYYLQPRSAGRFEAAHPRASKDRRVLLRIDGAARRTRLPATSLACR